jgi:DnaJ-class molecular chaperone
MEFGKRSLIQKSGPPAVAQETCVQCFGTGRIRERGDRIICKACGGTGRLAVKIERSA